MVFRIKVPAADRRKGEALLARRMEAGCHRHLVTCLEALRALANADPAAPGYTQTLARAKALVAQAEDDALIDRA